MTDLLLVLALISVLVVGNLLAYWLVWNRKAKTRRAAPESIMDRIARMEEKFGTIHSDVVTMTTAMIAKPTTDVTLLGPPSEWQPQKLGSATMMPRDWKAEQQAMQQEQALIAARVAEISASLAADAASKIQTVESFLDAVSETRPPTPAAALPTTPVTEPEPPKRRRVDLPPLTQGEPT